MLHWIRIGGILLILLCCASGGMLAGLRYRRRVSELEQALSLLGALKSRLRYTLAPPGELVSWLASQGEYAGCGYLTDAVGQICSGTGFCESWHRALERYSGALNGEDIAVILRLADILGRSDLQTQCGQLSMTEEQLSLRLSEAREQSAGGMKLCSTLGISLGLAVAILIL